MRDDVAFCVFVHTHSALALALVTVTMLRSTSQVSDNLPTDFKNLRACIVCSLVKSYNSFMGEQRVRVLVCYGCVHVHVCACVAQRVCVHVHMSPEISSELLALAEEGCENCPFLNMGGDVEKLSQCTTHDFEGFVASLFARSIRCVLRRHAPHALAP